MTSYNHLSSEERAIIQIARQDGETPAHIARRIGRDRSTVSRELARQSSEAYCATEAAQRYTRKRRRCRRRHKLGAGTPLFAKVRDMLEHRQWSPQQIAQRLQIDSPDDPSMHVCHETIYSAIYAYPRNELKKTMIGQLRRRRAQRGHRSKGKQNAAIQVDESQTIHARSEDIEARLTPGHWEGDLIVGAHNRSAIGTLVERTTGFVVLCKVASKSAQDVRESFERQLRKIDSFLRLSMTYDRGSEMAEHPLMSKRLKMDIYFADPHSPWQRGSNENTNGLLRQYFPKGTDLSVHSQTKLNDVAWLLNTRPRKRHQWLTPQEKFDVITADHIKACCT